MKIIAIITARGGSKRIPRKNIKNFNGKPIICYSIHAALQASIFDEVMVSTDDIEIAKISELNGAKVPFLRSNENSNDYSTTADVIDEVLQEYKKRGINFDYVCCIYPTAPFITSEKLINAYNLLVSRQVDSVVPIVKYSFPIFRSFKKKSDEFLELNWPEYSLKRSQDLPDSYHDAGQFYFIKVEEFLKTKKIFTSKTLGIEMPHLEVQDIDNVEDWEVAEFKYTFLNRNTKI